MRLFVFEKTFIPAVALGVILMGFYEASFTGYLLNIGPFTTKAILCVMCICAGLMFLSALGAGMCWTYHGILLWGGMLGMLLLASLFGVYAFVALYGMELFYSAGVLDATWYRSFQENWFFPLSILSTLLLARYFIWERSKFV
jgi:hypothetical protein